MENQESETNQLYRGTNQAPLTPDKSSCSREASLSQSSGDNGAFGKKKSNEPIDNTHQCNCFVAVEAALPCRPDENEKAKTNAYRRSSMNSKYQELPEQVYGPKMERAVPAAAAPTVADQQLSSPEASSVGRPMKYVGLINEGCTCYLNSLLQMLFHIGYLRSAVYHIPVENNHHHTSVYKALQELFFQMQERTTPARTKKLTDAFGWGESELFVQHDIQEMATLLRDNLEEKMKDTVTEGAINQLFQGEGVQFVETLDKDYISRSKDVFYDIHIPLSEHTNLLDGLKSLTVREELVGDNKYKVELAGRPAVYKDAEKGYEFKKFPYVTWFHLKRFSMDLTSPMLEMKKVNSRMEFPVVLDLTELERGYSPEELEELSAHTKRGAAVKSLSTDSPAIYDLQGVIVHRGTVRSGHYYCYIREWDPGKQCFARWLEFEDENVREVTEEMAIELNYGCSEQSPSAYYRGGSSSDTNAYILSYVRRADASTILASPPTDIIAQRVKDAMRREIEEEEHCAKLERELKQLVTVYVITDANLAEYCATHQVDLLSRDMRLLKNLAECALEFKKTTALSAVYETIAAEPVFVQRGLKTTSFRLWQWTNIRTFRPTKHLETYHESLRWGITLSNLVVSTEQEKPMVLCLYLQEPMQVIPYLPPVLDPQGLIKRFTYDTAKEIYTLVLRRPTRLCGLSLIVDALYAHSCNVKIAVIQGEKEQPVSMYKCILYDNRASVPLDAAQAIDQLVIQCTTSTEVLPVRDLHLMGNLSSLPPATTLAKPTLSRVCTDRVLLFFKFFDHISCNLRYLGSALIERIATLHSCEPLFFSFLGLPYDPKKQSNSPPSFRYFEEVKCLIVRELDAVQGDLLNNRLQDGALVVLQSAEIPLVMRHVHVEPYYRTLRCALEVELHEVVAQVCANDNNFRHFLKEHKALAAAQKKLTEGEFEQLALGVGRATAPPGGPPGVPAAPVSGPTPSSSSSALAAPSGGEPSLGSSRASPGLTSTGSQQHSSQMPGSQIERCYSLLDPYNAWPPVLRQISFAVQPPSSCAMNQNWQYETICDSIGQAKGVNPNQIRLYRASGPTVPYPAERPTHSSPLCTLESLLEGMSNPMLFYERLAEPRALVEQSAEVVVTLRDSVGHGLHRERYVLPPQVTLQGLVRAVRDSIRPYEWEENPWGTLAESLTAPHYVLLAHDRDKRLIRHILEVPMPSANMEANTNRKSNNTSSSSSSTDINNALSGAEGVEEIPLAASLADYDFDLQPAAPLRPSEQRIACCHGECSHDVPHIFGHPFIITVNARTTVQHAFEEMLRITRVPRSTVISRLRSGHNGSAMMLTETALRFDQWDQYLVLFWHHTLNNTGFIPNLMLNHLRPQEKPGSRYIAHNSPRLKISSN